MFQAGQPSFSRAQEAAPGLPLGRMPPRQFSVVAADRKVTDEERSELLETLGALYREPLRQVLAEQNVDWPGDGATLRFEYEDRHTERKLFSEDDLKNLVMSNVNSLFGKTTPKHFLDSCSTERRDYFSRLFARLDSAGLSPWLHEAATGRGRIGHMETKKFVYYEENGVLVGWLEEYPDYRTQGETMDELQANLLDLYKDLNSGEIPRVRRVGELSIA